MNTYTLKVLEIKQETNDSITLCFKQPALRKVKYLAGQYLTLIFRINGRRYIRPYSFSSAPNVDATLDVTIKRIPDGIVSNHIHDTVRVSDSIEVMTPMGDFVCDQPTDEVFLWGVGSGITPLFSIAKHLLADHPRTKVFLMYGNRSSGDTIFLSQLKTLGEIHSHRLVITYFHTRAVISKDISDVIEGRIDKLKAKDAVLRLGQKKDSLHYICGPTGLKQSVKAALDELSVAPEQIFSEDFELIKDPKDFANVSTEVVKLKFTNNQFDLEVTKGKTILESALEAGIELPYSCQTGNCSTCKGTLLNGQAKMIGLTKNRDDLGVEEYLLCCTYPLSNDVYIEIA